LVTESVAVTPYCVNLPRNRSSDRRLINTLPKWGHFKLKHSLKCTFVCFPGVTTHCSCIFTAR
jgi:hypothetical protein